jgi:hypothetical protein
MSEYTIIIYWRECALLIVYLISIIVALKIGYNTGKEVEKQKEIKQ